MEPDPALIQRLIRRGVLQLVVPSLILMVIPPLGTFLLGKPLSKQGMWEWTFGSSLTGGFVFAWLWWSIMVPKWKVFAYGACPPVLLPQLRHQAVEMKLIWPAGSIWEKTEIWTARDRARMAEILADKPASVSESTHLHS